MFLSEGFWKGVIKNVVFSQPDVLQLQEVGDFEAPNCLPPLNLIRSTKLHLTTEPPISCSTYVIGCAPHLVRYIVSAI